jgi:hypothetical protein
MVSDMYIKKLYLHHYGVNMILGQFKKGNIFKNILNVIMV